jgi:hypothetical protein
MGAAPFPAGFGYSDGFVMSAMVLDHLRTHPAVPSSHRCHCKGQCVRGPRVRCACVRESGNAYYPNGLLRSRAVMNGQEIIECNTQYAPHAPPFTHTPAHTYTHT